MDTRILRLASRIEGFSGVRCWQAPDGTFFAAVPPAFADYGYTTEVRCWIPGIDGTFYSRPNMASQREDLRRMIRACLARSAEYDET